LVLPKRITLCAGRREGANNGQQQLFAEVSWRICVFAIGAAKRADAPLTIRLCMYALRQADHGSRGRGIGY